MQDFEYGKENINIPGPESVAGSRGPRPEHKEGRVARSIETQTAKLLRYLSRWRGIHDRIGRTAGYGEERYQSVCRAMGSDTIDNGTL